MVNANQLADLELNIKYFIAILRYKPTSASFDPNYRVASVVCMAVHFFEWCTFWQRCFHHVAGNRFVLRGVKGELGGEWNWDIRRWVEDKTNENVKENNIDGNWTWW